MADNEIELVIKISKETYQGVVSASKIHGRWGNDLLGVLCTGIATGTLLPKGHGRLGDLDALEKEIANGIKAGNYEEGYETFAHINNIDDCIECVRYADIIIEADKSESEGINESQTSKKARKETIFRIFGQVF